MKTRVLAMGLCNVSTSSLTGEGPSAYRNIGDTMPTRMHTGVQWYRQGAFYRLTHRNRYHHIRRWTGWSFRTCYHLCHGSNFRSLRIQSCLRNHPLKSRCFLRSHLGKNRRCKTCWRVYRYNDVRDIFSSLCVLRWEEGDYRRYLRE